MKIPNNRKTAPVKPNPKVKQGSVVQFERGGKKLKGIVLEIRENSVMVEVDKATQKHLNIENERTIVNHKNYKVRK